MAKELNDNKLEGVVGGYIEHHFGSCDSGPMHRSWNYYLVKDDKDNSIIGRYESEEDAIKAAREKGISTKIKIYWNGHDMEQLEEKLGGLPKNDRSDVKREA